MLDTGPHTPAHCVAADAHTLSELFQCRVTHSGDATAWFAKSDGSWKPTSWTEWLVQSSAVAAGLVGLGIDPGDRVAILGPTGPWWAVLDIGAQLAGAVSMGIYPKQSVEQVRYLLAHSEAKIVFVTGAKELATVLAAVADLPSVVAVVPHDDTLVTDADSRLVRPSALAKTPWAPGEKERRFRCRGPDDTAIFVYTSGTTGPPKCAMIGHGNLISFLRSVDSAIDFYTDDLSLAFLPMAHVAERVLSFYARINAGFAAAYASSISAVLTELQEVQPTIFGSVPRIFEKAYSKIQTELAKKSPVVQRIFRWAEAVGRRHVRLTMAEQTVPLLLALQYRLADRLVFQKIRAAFGGRVKAFLVGAAPTPLPLLEFFWAAGLPLYEIYGMTESTVITHANGLLGTRLGTVGKVLKGTEHRIAEDGEILIRGPWVFQGYFKAPKITAETIVDGWLHTGDIGTIDADGYLKITDRKKHLIITAGGKNLAPANIECAIKTADPLISHVHPHGDRRPYVAALLAPSPLETLDFGLTHGVITAEDVATLTQELMAVPTARSDALAAAMKPITELPEFQARLCAAVAVGNRELAQVEKVKRFRILHRDFSQEGGELTPTMKVRRSDVEAMYAELIDRIYEEEGFALVPS